MNGGGQVEMNAAEKKTSPVKRQCYSKSEHSKRTFFLIRTLPSLSLSNQLRDCRSYITFILRNES